MSWFWTVIFLSFTVSTKISEAKHQNKFPSAVVVGTVYCDTCFQQNFPMANHFIAGASVAIECKNTSSRRSFRQEVKTNNHGEFRIHLPFSVSKHVKKIRGCSVELIRSNEPFCSVAAAATSFSLDMKSRKDGKRIFSAGFFTFKPLKQPQVCDQKPSNKNFKNFSDKKPSSISSSEKATDQLPFLPNPFSPPSIFPPNPFQPPSSIIPPIFPTPPPSIFPPIFPTPPPSIFPPIFPTPPPSIFPPIFPTPPPTIFPPIFPTPPFFHLPPFPGLIPSPPPPPPPIFPIPLPPLPFQPTPGFPGVPPAHVSSHSRTGSP